MARFHLATLSPTKAELIAAWAPTQSWGPPADAALELIGSYRFDDPDGRVGLEVHLAATPDGTLFQVPLTYRDEPVARLDRALISQMEHSVLGTRWVYDGLRDPQLVTMLAAVSMTGQGEALGMAVYEDRWYVAPTNVRIRGGGWDLRRVPVDGFEPVSGDGPMTAELINEQLSLTVHRRPVPGAQPAIGLTASWDGGPGDVVLTEVRER